MLEKEEKEKRRRRRRRILSRTRLPLAGSKKPGVPQKLKCRRKCMVLPCFGSFTAVSNFENCKKKSRLEIGQDFDHTVLL